MMMKDGEEILKQDSYKLIGHRIVAIVCCISAFYLSEFFTEIDFWNSGYNDAIRLGLFIASIWMAYTLFSRGIIGCAVVSAFSAFVYNPIFKLNLRGDSEELVDLIFGISFIWILIRLWKISRIMTPEVVQRANINQARAEAIEDAVKRGDLDPEFLEEISRKIKEKD